jgi:hypothetical protein
MPDVGAVVFNSIDQAQAFSAWDPLTFDSEHYDTGGFHSLVANTDRLVAPSTGWHFFTGNVKWDVQTGGQLSLRLRHNSTTPFAMVAHPFQASLNIYQNISGIYYMTAGDYATLETYHIGTGGAAQDILAASYISPEFGVTKMANEGARVFKDSNTSIPFAVWTTMNFNQETQDTDGIHDNVTNNSRLTCQTEGYYVIGGAIQFAAQVSGFRGLRIRLNGGNRIGGQKYDATAFANGMAHTVVTTYYLTPGDYVELEVYNFQGAVPQNLLYAADISPYFYMARIMDQP